jgi:RimJ/RimL family protein N-acetyltransferase
MIETDRLILRRFSDNDLLDLFEYLADPNVVKYEPYQPMSMQEVREELDRRIASDEMVAVVLKSSGKLIGNVYLGKRDNNALEIGFVFNKNYWNQGYARESCAALIHEAFSTGVDRIFAECDPENQNSWRLLERLGFSRTDHLEKNVFFWKDLDGHPIWKDTYIYSLE